MEISAVLGFAAIAFTLIAVPGPDWAFVLAASTRDRLVIPAVGGLLVGYALITLAVVAGVGPLVAAIPAAMFALTAAGSIYLLYVGVRTLQATRRTADTADAERAEKSMQQGPSAGQCFGRGIAVSGLNPKGILLFLAILPQFTSPSAAWPLPAQFGALGIVYICIAGAFYLSLGLIADRLLRRHPGLSRVTTRVAGIAMIAVGVLLAAERVIEMLR